MLNSGLLSIKMSLTAEQDQFWNTLKCPYYVADIRNDKDLTMAIKHYQYTNSMLDCLAMYFVKLADLFGSQETFAGYSYSYLEDMKADAVLMMTKHMLNFEIDSTTNPREYLTAVCSNVFMHTHAKEKNQQNTVRNQLKLMN